MHAARVCGVVCVLAAMAAIPMLPPAAQLDRVAGGLRNLNHGVFAPGDDDTLYVVEQRDRHAGESGTGRIRAIDLAAGEVVEQPLLELKGFSTDGDPLGITGFCFDPDFDTNHFVYVCATGENGSDGSDGQLVSVIARYELHEGVIDPATRMPVMTVPQQHLDHNANFIGFGPDGYLYVSLGDDSPMDLVDVDNNAQDLSSKSGKILRVDLQPDGPRGADFVVSDAGNRYNIPADNPFVDRPRADPAVFAYGLRNPFRLAWDRATGDLWISDTGQHHDEEVDRLPVGTSGQNFGYRMLEGVDPTPSVPVPDTTNPYPGPLVDPVYIYSHPPELTNHELPAGVEMGPFEGVCVIGGPVYWGAMQTWRGRYLFGDMDWRGHGGRFWSLRFSSGVAVDVQDHSALLESDGEHRVDMLTAFVEDNEGEVYLARR